jgi:hypothetical protein
MKMQMKRDDFCACDRFKNCPFKNKEPQLTPVQNANSILQLDGRIMRCRLKPNKPAKNRPTVFAESMKVHKQGILKMYGLVKAVRQALESYND